MSWDVPEDVLAEWGATPEPSEAVREHLAAEERPACARPGCGRPWSEHDYRTFCP